MNLQTDDLALFVRIVATGSLSAAARERNVPVSQVSRALTRLEAACQARLLHRNTHGLSLTDEGDACLAHARRMLAEAAELQGQLGRRRGGPSGWVRLSVSAVLAQAVVVPSLPSLYARHPGLQLDISASDGLADLARDGIDIAVRTGEPTQPNLVARPLGQLTRSLYAAPEYAQRHGLPESPDALERHHLLANTASPAVNRWSRRDGAADLVVAGRTRADNTAVTVALVLAGVGIGRIIDRVAQPLVRSGRLLPVLPEHFGTDPVPMVAVMLHERHRLPKLRACIEHLAAWVAAKD